ncbi:STAS domain-containing protein [Ideonella oryzae]|uniref:STAS domain-containing protein n=1 Tax=Ideonella oryzae TaxID=2937441 RepID=A0ABT1BN47_9BURK|nr:STAS domain-containing protein [Ideonella oryzae]MCO5977249.1 STAS domain-containing protein [Ideonella oryzae]
MLHLPAQITLSEARQVRDALLSQMAAETGPDLTLDASALGQVDSATLAVLLACRRQAQGRRWVVRGAPAQLADLARLYGVDGLLGLQPPQSSGA